MQVVIGLAPGRVLPLLAVIALAASLCCSASAAPPASSSLSAATRSTGGHARYAREASESPSPSPSTEPEPTTSPTPTQTPTPTPTPTPDPGLDLFNKTRSVGFLAVALPGLALTFFGYYWVGITVFLGGFIVCAVVFYVFSPRIFQHTEWCCGENGTLEGHVIASLIVGLCGGLLARFLFKAGIFFVGVCLGLLSAVLLLCTPLKDESAFQSDGALAGFYIGLMLLGGVASICIPRFFIILTTAWGGALCCLIGVDYFVESDFGSIILYALYRIGEAVRHDFKRSHASLSFDKDISDKALFMISGWVALSLIGLVTQYYLASKREDSVAIYMKKPRRMRSNELELNQRLVDKF